MIRGKDAIKIAFAGVGNPINDFVWFSSILNFANLKAEKTGIIRAKKGKILKLFIIKELSPDKLINLKIIRPGAKPKDIKSANESNSLPISDFIFNNRADIPSKKSNIDANTIKKDAIYKSYFKATITAIQPLSKFNEVIKLGICFFIAIFF